MATSAILSENLLRRVNHMAVANDEVVFGGASGWGKGKRCWKRGRGAEESSAGHGWFSTIVANLRRISWAIFRVR